MSEQTKVTDQDIKDAMDEAPELPDGAWLEWVAERAGFEPSEGYLVAERIGQNPEFFGGTEETAPPMRITVQSTVEELDDELLVDLTDDEVQRLIDLECGRQGVPLLPNHPGPKPKKPEVENDVQTYTVCLGWSSVAEVKDRMVATRLAEALADIPQVTVSHKRGTGGVYTGIRVEDVKVEPQRRLSEEKYKEHQQELEAFSTAEERWKTLDKEYRTARDAQEHIRTGIQKAIEEAWARQRQRENAERLWARYLDLAEGDKKTAGRFLEDADQDAFELMVEAGVVPTEFPDEAEPWEEDADSGSAAV